MKKVEVVDNKITCKKCNLTKDVIYFCARPENNSYRGVCKKCSKGYKTSLVERQVHIFTLIANGTKQCGKCKETKELSNFGKDKYARYGYSSNCKLCISNNGKGKNKFIALKTKYGITAADYSNLLTAQNYKCCICKISLLSLDKRHIHLDHCHTTGKVRGILCNHCNHGLGNFKDNRELLLNAISYLTKNQDND